MSDGGPSLAIRLHRDALSTPWGFRLQGGKDFKTPLRVQRVFVGSPAEGELQRGDVIVAIDNYDVSQLTHIEAEDLIRKAGGSVLLRVRRAAGFIQTPSSPSPSFARHPPKSPSSQYRSHPSFVPRPSSSASSVARDSPMAHLRSPTWQMNFGTDYTQYPGRQQAQPRVAAGRSAQDGGMLNRLNSSLTQALFEGNHDNGAADDYESKSVGQLRQQFAALSPTNTGHQPSNDPRKRWSRPQGSTFSPAPNHLTDLGWTPFSSNKAQPQRYARQSQRSSSPPVNSPFRPQPPRPATAHEFDKPAWAGTLRSSGGPRHWEMTQAESITPGSVPRQYREAHSEPPAMPQVHRANSGGSSVTPVQPHQPKIQVMRYGPTGQQVYEQHEAPQYGDSDSARVVHLQYNTPLGLYSRENVEQALEGQTHNKAGYGTMEVSGGSPGKQYNPANSAVLRLLAEEEGLKTGPGGRGRKAVPSNTSTGSELKQSPMIYALDATYGNGAAADDHVAAGMSDF